MELIDLKFLKNCLLEEIGIGQYIIIFRFSRNVTISVERNFTIINPDGFESIIEITPKSGDIFELLGREIDATYVKEGLLFILFSCGNILAFDIAQKHFENLTITSESGNWVF